jgi:phage terminase small subunit
MTSTVLTVKQARFCDEYVVCGNAAAAARAAGYRERSARQIGFENLTKHDIQTAIQARQQALAARLEIDRAAVIAAVLEAIEAAKEQGEPATCIRGWVTVAKMAGLDKPEPHQDRPLSPGAERIRSKFEAMSTSELLEILAAKD